MVHHSDPLMVDAARACRFYLAQLLPHDDVESVDSAIRAVLERATMENADIKLEQIFGAHPALHDWVAAYFEHGIPMEFLEYAERSAIPPGDMAPLPPPAKFVCPVDENFLIFARLAFARPSKCPDHAVQLIPAADNERQVT